MVSLMRYNRHVCGGTLIAKDTVLTAGHCIIDGLSHVRIGSHDLNDYRSDTFEIMTIEKTEIHPLYDETGDVTVYDYAMIKLFGSAEINPVKLNTDDMIPATETDPVTTVGWGATNKNNRYTFSNILNEVTLRYVPYDICKKAKGKYKNGQDVKFSNFLDETMICAFEDEKDSCQGDSGGPLLFSEQSGNEGHMVQVGIVSFGYSCASGFPGLYSRVSNQFDWIRNTMCEMSDMPPDYFNCKQKEAYTAGKPTNITIEIKFDFYPEEVGWLVQSISDRHVNKYVSIGTYSGATYQNKIIKETVEVDFDKEYRFVLFDKGSNGLCCIYGKGKYNVYHSSSFTSNSEASVPLFSGGTFYSKTHDEKRFILTLASDAPSLLPSISSQPSTLPTNAIPSSLPTQEITILPSNAPTTYPSISISPSTTSRAKKNKRFSNDFLQNDPETNSIPESESESEDKSGKTKKVGQPIVETEAQSFSSSNSAFVPLVSQDPVNIPTSSSHISNPTIWIGLSILFSTQFISL